MWQVLQSVESSVATFFAGSFSRNRAQPSRLPRHPFYGSTDLIQKIHESSPSCREPDWNSLKFVKETNVVVTQERARITWVDYARGVVVSSSFSAMSFADSVPVKSSRMERHSVPSILGFIRSTCPCSSCFPGCSSERRIGRSGGIFLRGRIRFDRLPLPGLVGAPDLGPARPRPLHQHQGESL